MYLRQNTEKGVAEEKLWGKRCIQKYFQLTGQKRPPRAGNAFPASAAIVSLSLKTYVKSKKRP